MCTSPSYITVSIAKDNRCWWNKMEVLSVRSGPYRFRPSSGVRRFTDSVNEN